jgi:predicted Fe-S protein YdhL (DUF1289 family)
MSDLEVIARSPCLGDCNPNIDGICLSCFLSSEENDKWNHVSNKERLAFVENALLRQKANSEGRSLTEIDTSNRG